MTQVVLASGSPRRSEILTALNIPFQKMVSDINEEAYLEENPISLVQTLSLEKAKSILTDVSEDALIIAADTIVWFKGNALGKPKNYEDAYSIITMLSGKCHQVYTGITMIDVKTQTSFTDYCMTKVYMRNLKEDEIKGYINTKEPFDKAGAYGIQGFGATLIKKIEGDYFNVVGLPISKLIEGFNVLGIDYFDSFHN
jgi:septum formation protein